MLCLLIFSLLAISDLTLSESSEYFASCVNKISPRPLSKSHGFTSRGFEEMKSAMPPFFDLLEYNYTDKRILDFGCGNGHAILEIQSILPESACVCTNKIDYGYVQTSTQNMFLDVAAAYNITLYCNSKNEIKLPRVVMIEGLQAGALIFGRSFDLVVSQHALNEGVVQTTCVLWWNADIL